MRRFLNTLAGIVLIIYAITLVLVNMFVPSAMAVAGVIIGICLLIDIVTYAIARKLVR